jgi:hypothetical protein
MRCVLPAGAVVLALLTIVAGLGLVAPAGHGSTNSAPAAECQSCHTETPEQVEVRVEGLGATWEPRKTYDVAVTVQSPLASQGEVQGGLSVNVSAGELVVTDDVATQRSEAFLTHTQEGSKRRTWTFRWQAPPDGIAVELRVSGMAANGDFTPLGDATAAAVFTIRRKSE